MNNSEGKVNKQLSKYYVEHACNISSEGQVAKELNLASSRISDLKGGRRQLTAEQAEIIKRIYGIPSTSDGHWIEGELLSFCDLKKAYCDNGLAIHFANIIDLLSSDSFINSIIDRIEVETSNITGYVRDIFSINEKKDRAGVEQKNKRLVREHKLRLFNKLLGANNFHAWCDAVMRFIEIHQDWEDIHKIVREKDILSPVQTNGSNYFEAPTSENTSLLKIFDSIESGFFIRFDQLPVRCVMEIEELIIIHKTRELVSNKTYAYLLSKKANFCFGEKLSVNHQSLPIKEYVVVGKCVWSSNSIDMLNKPLLSKSVIGWSSGHDYFYSANKAIGPEKITYLSSRLFYTEQYQYLIEIKLFEDQDATESRRLLIKIKDKQNIFKELIDIYDHFGVEHKLTLKSIKQSVASNGGYIPSAIYLD